RLRIPVTHALNLQGACIVNWGGRILVGGVCCSICWGCWFENKLASIVNDKDLSSISAGERGGAGENGSPKGGEIGR
ncbi:MAG: hypothetical protein KBH45_18935, partial [Verrucomicrobia bacterium]|nr:hypothetical protein [Verrucomicrobiota bacterium]